jgi:hypothetical protein
MSVAFNAAGESCTFYSVRLMTWPLLPKREFSCSGGSGMPRFTAMTRGFRSPAPHRSAGYS